MLGNELATLEQLTCPAALPHGASDAIPESVTPESAQRTKIAA